jgi:superoxide dismutase, Cu-Zn family
MKRAHVVACSLLVASLLAGCATGMSGSSARATLAARSGSTVAGDVMFTEQSGGLRVEVHATGLSPGEHGFHIHEIGDCSAPDASSAKGHYNPAGKAHGHHASDNRHGGDLPNLTADAKGEARFVADLKGLSLNEIFGRSVVIHADPDDYQSQPAGNSGKRVACGVIVAR